MNYASMLDQIIQDSELSLRKLSKRCNDLGLKITPSYISQLKNAKLPPPSEEVSMILAKACGSDKQAHLVFQGYIEKAPNLVKEYMIASSNLNKMLLEDLCKDKNQNYTDQMHDYIKELDILSAMELSSSYLSTNNPDKLRNLVKEICLNAGEVAFADTEGELTNMFLADNSMAPAIPMHAYLYIMPTKTDLLKDKDIIAFYSEGRRVPTLRRIFFIKGKILLIPDDKSYETYFHTSLEEIQYIGKLVSYKVDL